MTRNKILALSLSFLLLAGGPAFAEDKPPESSGEPVRAEEKSPLSKAGLSMPAIHSELADESLQKVSELPTAEMSGAILNAIELPKGMTYEPFDFLPVSMDNYGGLLTMKGKKYTGTAIAAGASFKGKSSDEYFGGMFLPHGYTQESAGKMLNFNIGLLKIESAMNEIFLNTMKEVRKETKEPIPYSFFALSMLNVEQLHKVKDKPKTYSFSLRPTLSVDGFVVPLFVRGFASKVDDTYRFLLLATFDSQKDMVSFAGLKLINEPLMDIK